MQTAVERWWFPVAGSSTFFAYEVFHAPKPARPCLWLASMGLQVNCRAETHLPGRGQVSGLLQTVLRSLLEIRQTFIWKRMYSDIWGTRPWLQFKAVEQSSAFQDGGSSLRHVLYLYFTAALTPLQPTASAGAAAAGQSHVCVAQHPPVTIPPVRAGKECPTGA